MAVMKGPGREYRLVPMARELTDQAACKGKTSLYFDTQVTGRPGAEERKRGRPSNANLERHSEATLRAKRICATCPINHECLEYALAHSFLEGVWGGMTKSERRSERRKRQASRRRTRT